jgi:hypothetical protein
MEKLPTFKEWLERKDEGFFGTLFGGGDPELAKLTPDERAAFDRDYKQLMASGVGSAEARAIALKNAGTQGNMNKITQYRMQTGQAPNTFAHQSQYKGKLTGNMPLAPTPLPTRNDLDNRYRNSVTG